jgi:hypothetical protein
MKVSMIVSSCGSPLLDSWDSAYHLIRIGNDTIRIEPREFVGGMFSRKTEYAFERLRIDASHPVGS